MDYYNDVYLKRLNRYGNDYQSRIQGQREKEFDSYLLKSVYRIDFEYNDGTVTDIYPGVLEPNKQDDSQTTAYLLTRTSLNLPNGTILMIKDKDTIERAWMVWWLENMQASGYNRYTMLRMSNEITWKIGTASYTQWAYFYGPGNKAINDTIKSSTGKALYGENNNLHLFITPANANIKKEIYFTVTESGVEQGYRVTDFDLVSTKGVEYVSVDPSYVRDLTPAPAKPSGHTGDEYFWFGGQ